MIKPNKPSSDTTKQLLRDIATRLDRTIGCTHRVYPPNKMCSCVEFRTFVKRKLEELESK